jgi:hypothetical protein
MISEGSSKPFSGEGEIGMRTSGTRSRSVVIRKIGQGRGGEGVIGLDDQRRTGFSQLSWRCDGDDVASNQTQPSWACTLSTTPFHSDGQELQTRQ